MENKKKIIGSNKDKFTGALHTGFHERIYQVVSEAIAKEPGLKLPVDLMPGYDGKIKVQVELNRRARARIETKQQKLVDRVRNRYITHAFDKIDIARNSPDPTEEEASSVLKIAIKDYRKIQKEGLDSKTTYIQGMLLDLRKAENTPHVTALGLTKTMDALEAKNNEFYQLRITRTKARTTSLHITSKDARHETDAFYKRICEIIYGDYLRATEEAEVRMFEALIDEMNQIISEFKAMHNMSAAQKNRPVE